MSAETFTYVAITDRLGFSSAFRAFVNRLRLPRQRRHNGNALVAVDLAERPTAPYRLCTGEQGNRPTLGRRCVATGTKSPGDWLVPAAQHKIGGQMRFVKAWMDAVKFNLEVQSVVAMRLMKIAAGGATGAAESTKMVREKAEASVAALTAGALALAKGGSVKAATKAAMVPVKKRVRANRKRLSGGR
jgi:hypothetical protein